MKLVMRLTLAVLVSAALASTTLADLLVCSINGDRILRFSETDGAYLGDFVPVGTGGLNEPQGMEYGPDGNLYVCSNDQHAVLRFDGQTGAFIDAFVPPGSGG
ncbi:MAG: PEP-CTERM sorting domain-containing protein, partial [Armatimonadota bacterium]